MCIQIPENSATARECYDSNARNGLQHSPGIWFYGEEIIEHDIYSEVYGKTLTILTVSEAVDYTKNEEYEDEALLV